MKKIGITGGIGSGKTTVCEIFKLLGVPVFHADDEARNLQNTDIQIRRSIIKHFGEQIYSQEGILDRKKLAAIVFNNPVALAKLNAIIHPAVRENFLKWTENHLEEPYVLYEAAILIESGYGSDFDKTILIVADEKSRIGRVTRRDGSPEELVKQRISNQMTDIQKIKHVDYIIENNNNELLIPRVIELDRLIRENTKNC